MNAVPTPIASIPQDLFERRLEAWQATLTRFGPARAYPYAWRLPDLARPAGQSAVVRARYALGLTLHDLGRFGEALACLDWPGTDTPPASAILQARCLCLLGRREEALALAHAAWQQESASLANLAAQAYLPFLVDDAARALPACIAYGSAARNAGARIDAYWSEVLAYWAHARLSLALDEAGVHLALAGLRTLAPAQAAHGEAIQAEALFHQGPHWAAVLLDNALVQCERYGQHHIKARLLSLKARSLAATGQLGEAARFHKLARDLGQRQGATLYETGAW